MQEQDRQISTNPCLFACIRGVYVRILKFYINLQNTIFDQLYMLLLSKSTRMEWEVPLRLILSEGKIPIYTS
jgi:hypothetical protein